MPPGYCQKHAAPRSKAAPVKWDQAQVKEQAYAQAVIVNSGIANACTGAEGFGYCKDSFDVKEYIL